MTAETVQTGEFAGWQTWPDEPFEHDAAGPFYFKIDDDGPVAAFRAQRKHMNAGGVMHGGCLMAFGDFSLFAIAHDGMEGEYIEARGEVLRKGGSITFVRGLVTANGRPVLNFSGTIKKRKKRT